jgi:hypothetical protein
MGPFGFLEILLTRVNGEWETMDIFPISSVIKNVNVVGIKDINIGWPYNILKIVQLHFIMFALVVLLNSLLKETLEKLEIKNNMSKTWGKIITLRRKQ